MTASAASIAFHTFRASLFLLGVCLACFCWEVKVWLAEEAIAEKGQAEMRYLYLQSRFQLAASSVLLCLDLAVLFRLVSFPFI